MSGAQVRFQQAIWQVLGGRESVFRRLWMLYHVLTWVQEALKLPIYFTGRIAHEVSLDDLLFNVGCCGLFFFYNHAIVIALGGRLYCWVVTRWVQIPLLVRVASSVPPLLSSSLCPLPLHQNLPSCLSQTSSPRSRSLSYILQVSLLS